MSGDKDCIVLVLAIENAELRQQLADAQDMLLEIATDAGRIHAENTMLRDDLAQLYAERHANQLVA